MGVFGWAEVVALVTSVAFGTLSAVIPIANAEAYVIASQVSEMAGAVPVAVGVGIGQTVGKLLLFLGVRRGRDFRFVVKARAAAAARRPVSPGRARIRAVVAKLLNLIGTRRLGLPIVLLAAVIGVPPLYAVALFAGATKMRVGWFVLCVLVGRVTRFVLVATGSQGLHHWLI